MVRLINLIKKEKVVYGGNYNKETSKIEPTIMNIEENELNLNVMQEEIFGPILPILEFSGIQEAIDYINKKEHPLALYLFTNNKNTEKLVTSSIKFGGGCINDTVIHLANTKLGFGGIGNSGMGSYHGKFSFDTFTHYTSIVKKSTIIDLPMRYHPYKKINEKIIKLFMR